jgi:LacI family transcriptional regulator
MARSTILDIAQLAGVSWHVSRVINRRPDVDKQTRERVQRIIAEGHVPSITAAGLAGGRNRLIGMLCRSSPPILADLVRGISEILKQTSAELVLYRMTTNLTRDRRAIINHLLATQLTAGLRRLS